MRRLPLLLASGAMMAGMCVAVSPPSPSWALSPGVTITSSQVNVRTTNAGVTLTRNPARLSFQDGANTTVLNEVAAPSSPVSKSVADYGHHVPNPATYAPLTFIVGSRTMNQSGWGYFQGQPEAIFGSTGSITGNEYGPTGVVSANQQGTGAHIVMSTSDPSGRQLTLDLRPGSDGASITVNVSFSSSSGVVFVNDSFGATTSEAFRGFGGRHDGLNQRGRNFYNSVEQENDETDTSSTNLSPSPAGPLAAYYAQPMFVSSQNYGFLVNQTEMSSFRLATDSSTTWQTSVAASTLNYVVAPGAYKAAIQSLTTYSGRNAVPPAWALGAIEGEESGANTSCDATCYAGRLDTDLARIDQNHVPLTGFVIDQSWYLDKAGLTAKYVNAFRSRNIHPMGYLKANLTALDIGFDNATDLSYAQSRGYTIKDGSNQPTSYIDFTNPAATTWWKTYVTSYLDKGYDGFMQDFGEGIVNSWKFYDGTPGAVMHNRYPVLYSQATRQAVDSYQAAHPDRQIWTFARSGYTGSAGVEGGSFGGDNRSSWGRANGIGSITSDMLNRGVGGAYAYTTDIGGYWDNTATTKELFLRWSQLGALSPVFRTHNGFYNSSYHAWQYDSQAISTFNAAAALHIRASGYIAGLMQQAQTTGLPAARPLWLEYPTDTTAAAQDQEWLLGTNLLVAPVISQGATTRPVYFPAGCWTDPTTNQQFQGPTTSTINTPITKLPYYFKCGTTPF